MSKTLFRHFTKEHIQIAHKNIRDLPGSPVVKTSPSSEGGVGWIPGQGAETPHALQAKNQNT